MPLYEHVYLARQDLSQQQVDELTAQYKGVIEQWAATSPRWNIGASSPSPTASARTARRISP